MIKIKQIFLNNFQNHIETKINLNLINIFAGDNGAGKTPIIQAILYILRGFAGNMIDVDDVKNEDLLIRNGADDMTVAIDLQCDGDEFRFIKEKRRGMPHKIRIIQNGEELIFTQGDGSTRETIQEDIGTSLGIDYRQLCAVIDSFYFMSLGFSEREQLIFDLMGVNWTEDILKEQLLQHEIPEAIISEYINMILQSSFEDAQKKAESSWTGLKMKLENPINLEDFDDEILFHNQDRKISDLSSNEIESDIKALEENQSELNRRRGRLEGEADFDIIGRDREVLELTNTINELKDSIKGYQSIEEIKEQLTTNKQDVGEISKRLAQLQIEIATRANEITILENHLDELRKTDDGKCSFCRSKLKQDQIKKLIKDLEKKSTHVESILDELKIDHRNFSADYNKKTELVEYSEKLIKTIETTTSQIKEQEKLRDQIKQEIAEKKDKAIKAKNELSTIDARLKKISTAKEVLNEILSKISTYQEMVKRLKEFEANKTEFEKQLSIFDKLRLLLLPNGILKDIVQSQLQPLNDRLAFLNAYELTDPIQLNEDWSINIGDRHESQVHRRGSEFSRIGFLFQEMFSYLSKIGLWLCDGTDILSSVNRIKLLKIAADVHQDYGNILMSITKSVPQPLSRAVLERGEIDPNLLNHFSYFWIEEGGVREVPAMERISRQTETIRPLSRTGELSVRDE